MESKDDKKGITIVLPEKFQNQYEDLKKIYARGHKSLEKSLEKVVTHYIKDKSLL